MSIFLCSVCGYVSFGNVPAVCPVCHASEEKFTQKDNLFKESAEKSPEGAGKHRPVISVVKDCKLVDVPCTDILIKVGEIAHPMEEKHFIQNIDCYVDNVFVSRVYFTPSVNAAAAVHLKINGIKVRVVEHCNLHGWWESEASL